MFCCCCVVVVFGGYASLLSWIMHPVLLQPHRGKTVKCNKENNTWPTSAPGSFRQSHHRRSWQWENWRRSHLGWQQSVPTFSHHPSWPSADPHPLHAGLAPDTPDVGSAGAPPGWHSPQHSHLITNHNPETETSAVEVSLLTILPFTYPLTYRPTPETLDVGSAGASPGWHSLQCSLLITNHNNPKIETSAKEVSLLTILPFTCPTTYKLATDS